MPQITSTVRLQDFEAGEGPQQTYIGTVQLMTIFPNLKSSVRVYLDVFWWAIYPTVFVLATSGMPKSAASLNITKA